MWIIAYTKSRCEKKVEQLLNEVTLEGVQHPLIGDALVIRVKRKWSDRIKVVELPSISGYVFIRFAEGLSDKVKAELLVKLHYIPGLLRLLTYPHRSSYDLKSLPTVSQRELDIIRAAAEASGNSLMPPESPITTGCTVRFTDGPLAELDVTFTVDDMEKDVPTLYIGEGIFKNARFKVTKEHLEVVPATEPQKETTTQSPQPAIVT